ncbi:MAG: Hsp20/alpha crystallin family protein [Candidatus Diapherotrites archaeon]|nr:Hsp20/alpha crystallin family protein [Candidatus Diapherotrites archaeon]
MNDDWEYDDTFKRMQDEMDNMFNRFFGGVPQNNKPKPQQETTRDVKIDLIETEKYIYLTAELPGAEKDDVHVKVDKKEVEIQAKLPYIPQKTPVFYKMIELPAPVKKDKTEATFKNGILELKLAKTHQLFKDKSKGDLQIE